MGRGERKRKWACGGGTAGFFKTDGIIAAEEAKEQLSSDT